MIDAARRGKARAEDAPAQAPHVTTHAGLRGAARERLAERGRERGGGAGADQSPACTGWDVEDNHLTAERGLGRHRIDECVDHRAEWAVTVATTRTALGRGETVRYL